MKPQKLLEQNFLHMVLIQAAVLLKLYFYSDTEQIYD